MAYNRAHKLKCIFYIEATSMIKDRNIFEAITRWAMRSMRCNGSYSAKLYRYLITCISALWYHISSSKYTKIFKLSRTITAWHAPLSYDYTYTHTSPYLLTHSITYFTLNFQVISHNPLPSVDYEQKQMNTRYKRINIYIEGKKARTHTHKKNECICRQCHSNWERQKDMPTNMS